MTAERAPLSRVHPTLIPIALSSLTNLHATIFSSCSALPSQSPKSLQSCHLGKVELRGHSFTVPLSRVRRAPLPCVSRLPAPLRYAFLATAHNQLSFIHTTIGEARSNFFSRRLISHKLQGHSSRLAGDVARPSSKPLLVTCASPVVLQFA